MSVFNDVMASYNESAEDFQYEPEIADIDFDTVDSLDESTELNEYMLQLTHECDMYMAKLNTAIIAEEYCYLRENGEEMVWENRFKDIWDSFINWCKELWAKITSWFKSVMAKIDNFMHDDSKFLEKYKVKKKSVKLNGYDPFVMDIKTFSKTFDTNVKDSELVVSNIINSVKNGEKLNKYDSETKRNDKIIDKDEKNIEKYTEKKLREYNTNTAVSFLKGFQAVRTNLKNSYDKAKKFINSCIKVAKSAQKINAKANKDLSKEWHKAIGIMKKELKFLTVDLKNMLTYIAKGRALAKAIVKAASVDTNVKVPTAESMVFDTIMDSDF